jgi:uncharacterized protein DUF664
VVKHLTGTERFWFSIDFANLDVTWPWTDDDLHGNFRIEPGDTLATIVADYVKECGRSRRAVADTRLDDAARGEGMDFTLRYAMIHMIQETARHCGHAATEASSLSWFETVRLPPSVSMSVATSSVSQCLAWN